MATAWLDERAADTVFAARGMGRPLWLGKGRSEVVFASTVAALELVERYTGVGLDKREIDEGHAGDAPRRRRGRVPRRSRSTAPSPRSPSPPFALRMKGVPCLERLAALAARRLRGARAGLVAEFPEERARLGLDGRELLLAQIRAVAADRRAVRGAQALGQLRGVHAEARGQVRGHSGGIGRELLVAQLVRALDLARPRSRSAATPTRRGSHRRRSRTPSARPASTQKRGAAP